MARSITASTQAGMRLCSTLACVGSGVGRGPAVKPVSLSSPGTGHEDAICSKHGNSSDNAQPVTGKRRTSASAEVSVPSCDPAGGSSR